MFLALDLSCEQLWTVYNRSKAIIVLLLGHAYSSRRTSSIAKSIVEESVIFCIFYIDIEERGGGGRGVDEGGVVDLTRAWRNTLKRASHDHSSLVHVHSPCHTPYCRSHSYLRAKYTLCSMHTDIGSRATRQGLHFFLQIFCHWHRAPYIASYP